jgi:hypothetical protein
LHTAVDIGAVVTAQPNTSEVVTWMAAILAAVQPYRDGDEFGDIVGVEFAQAQFDRGKKVCARRRTAPRLRGSRFANKLDFIGDRRECPELYLLLWRLSVCLNL